MREIKFRIRNRRTKKLVAEEWLKDGFWYHCILSDFSADGSPWVHNGIYKGSILEDYSREQYTGLHDRTGKEIYEGDIVDREDKGIFEVKWNDNCAGFIMGDEPNWHWLKKDYSHLYSIIGNRFENPELMEEMK